MGIVLTRRRGIGAVFGVSLAVLLIGSVIPSSYGSGTDCSDIPVRNFKGVLFKDKTLSRDEDGGLRTPSGYVAESMKYIKSNGFNAIRVPYYWEAYVFSPSAFMNEIELIAKAARDRGLCVIFSNFHYYASSYWNLDVPGKSSGRGFPSFVVNDFAKRNNNYEDTAGPFWNAFLSNNIYINGKKVWLVQFEFISKVVNKVKNLNSVAGFEILNEPHLFKKEQYNKLGDYHTYMAKKIRSITDKKIFFARETTRGFDRQPDLEYKIVPDGVSRVVYAPQLYSVPTSGSIGKQQINNFDNWSEKWGKEVLISEWAADTKSEAVTFLKAFKAKGFGWTATSWTRLQSSGLDTNLYQSDTVPRTSALKTLIAATQTVY